MPPKPKEVTIKYEVVVNLGNYQSVRATIERTYDGKDVDGADYERAVDDLQQDVIGQARELATAFNNPGGRSVTMGSKQIMDDDFGSIAKGLNG